MNEEQTYAAEPWAPFWNDRAHDRASQLKAEIGQALYGQFIDALPEEFFTATSFQIRAKSFERCLRAVHELPLGEAPTLELLLSSYKYSKE